MNNRIYLVDLFRGFAVINMIIYHTLYDLKYIFYLEMPYFSIEKWYYYQQSICVTFIFLSGFSANFSKKLLKNSTRLALTASIITIVTTMISKELAIYFGVIHLLAFSMAFIYLIDKLYKTNNKNSHIFCLIVSLGLFVYLKSNFFSNSYLYFHLYTIISKFDLSFVIGFPRDDFYSSDYFPILPWLILVFTGYFAGKYYKLCPLLQNFDKNIKTVLYKHTAILSYISKHSLIIYIFHQIIIYGFLYIIFNT